MVGVVVGGVFSGLLLLPRSLLPATASVWSPSITSLLRGCRKTKCIIFQNTKVSYTIK